MINDEQRVAEFMQRYDEADADGKKALRKEKQQLINDMRATMYQLESKARVHHVTSMQVSGDERTTHKKAAARLYAEADQYREMAKKLGARLLYN